MPESESQPRKRGNQPPIMPTILDIDTPLRLDVIAKIAFPDGTLGFPGLRKERNNGRLETAIIAGKEYASMLDICRMRIRCGYQRQNASNDLTPEEMKEAEIMARNMVRNYLARTSKDIEGE